MIDCSKIDMRDSVFNELYKIALNDKDVILINADTPAFVLEKYILEMPKQYINTGVSEQSMILASAGLAMSGKKVFIYSLIPFIALRCYEFIKVNICSMNLPVTIIGGGAGFSFSYDGPTHHAICDIALMRTLPEISIYNPSDSSIATTCIRNSYENNVPSYIRLDKGAHLTLNRDSLHGFSEVKSGKNICIVSTGIMTHTAIDVANNLKQHNFDISVIDLYRIKPLNEYDLLERLMEFDAIVTLEENSIIGGIGSMISELMIDNNLFLYLKRIALPDTQSFIYGSRNWLHKQYKIDSDSVAQNIINWYKEIL